MFQSYSISTSSLHPFLLRPPCSTLICSPFSLIKSTDRIRESMLTSAAGRRAVWALLSDLIKRTVVRQVSTLHYSPLTLSHSFCVSTPFTLQSRCFSSCWLDLSTASRIIEKETGSGFQSACVSIRANVETSQLFKQNIKRNLTIALVVILWHGVVLWRVSISTKPPGSLHRATWEEPKSRIWYFEGCTQVKWMEKVILRFTVQCIYTTKNTST